jgi:hypothetical protein
MDRKKVCDKLIMVTPKKLEKQNSMILTPLLG